MDTSMIDPALLAIQPVALAGNAVADFGAGGDAGKEQEREHDESDPDAEGEEEDFDMDAEGEEWEEPHVDQALYEPSQPEETYHDYHQLDPSADHALAGPLDQSSYDAAAVELPADEGPKEYVFDLPRPAPAPGPGSSSQSNGASVRKKGRPSKSDPRYGRNGSMPSLGSRGSDSLTTNNATPGPSRVNGRTPGPSRPVRTHSTPMASSSTGSAGQSRPRTKTVTAPPTGSGLSKGKGKGKGKGKEKEKALTFDDTCAICSGPEERNRRGEAERMASCTLCGSSGHPSCIGLSPECTEVVFTYAWTCMECKTCEKCHFPGNDDTLLFCDSCDKGYHTYCLTPKLSQPPEGKWNCPICRAKGKNPKGIPGAGVCPPGKAGYKGKGKDRTVLHDDVGGVDATHHPAIKIKSLSHSLSQSQPTPQSRRRPGRPPKSSYALADDFDDWDVASASSTPQPNGRSGVKKRKRTDRDDGSDDGGGGDDDSYSASPAPRLKVRLTVGSARAGANGVVAHASKTGRPRGRPPGAKTGSGRGRPPGRGQGRASGGGFGSSAFGHADLADDGDGTYEDEEAGEEEEDEEAVQEEEEEQIPYGGIIEGADADTTKTRITSADMAAFERSAKAAETRLGGPMSQHAFDPLGTGAGAGAGATTPSTEKGRKRKAVDDDDYAAPGSPGPGAQTPTPGLKIARGRSLRDRLLDRSIGMSASTPDLGSPSPAPAGSSTGTGTGGVSGGWEGGGGGGPGTSTPTRSSAGANGSYFALSADGHTPTASAVTTGAQSPGPRAASIAAQNLGQGQGQGQAPRASEKIRQIRFGNMDIDTWYAAPYPEEYQYVPDGRLWLCEFCLRYMHSGFVAGRHRLKCKARHPPGDEVYREGEVSVFEVDGRKNKIYCQQLCLLAKMFLEAKTLYYDVEPFLFYVMTQVDDMGARFVGYFSKEKRSPINNVSCIMTLPVRQRKGWGQLLIDFSYQLSKKEDRVGSPEKPLSGLGEVTYKTYWKLTIFRYLRDAVGEVSMDDISKATSMTLVDIFSTLKEQDMIRLYTPSPPPVLLPVSYKQRAPGRGRGRGRGRGGAAAAARRMAAASGSGAESSANGSEASDEIKVPEKGTYSITYDRDYVVAVLKQDEAKGKLQLNPERVKYHPFLVTRAVKEAQEQEARREAEAEEREKEREEQEQQLADKDKEQEQPGSVSKEGDPTDESASALIGIQDSQDIRLGSGVSATNDRPTGEDKGTNGDTNKESQGDLGKDLGAGRVEVIASQADAAILERVEAFAGAAHEHDHGGDDYHSRPQPPSSLQTTHRKRQRTTASEVGGRTSPATKVNGTAGMLLSSAVGAEADKAANGNEAVDADVVHGEDRETLQLVAALSSQEESPKRSMRKREGTAVSATRLRTPGPDRNRATSISRSVPGSARRDRATRSSASLAVGGEGAGSPRSPLKGR